MSVENWLHYIMPKLDNQIEQGKTPVNIHVIDRRLVLAFDTGRPQGPGFKLRATRTDIQHPTMRFIQALGNVLQHNIETDRLPKNPPTLTYGGYLS